MNARKDNEAKAELRGTLSLEELLASKSRIKILKALALNGSLNISGIRKCTGLNYRSIQRALQVFKCMRVVGEVHLERSRTFRIKVENEEGSEVDVFMKSLGDLERDQPYVDESVVPSVSNNAVLTTTRYKDLSLSALMTD